MILILIPYSFCLSLSGVFPANEGLTAILDYLIDNLGNEKAVLQSLSAIRDITQNENLDDLGKKILIKCLRDYLAEPAVQCLVMACFENLVQYGEYLLQYYLSTSLLKIIYDTVLLFSNE